MDMLPGPMTTGHRFGSLGETSLIERNAWQSSMATLKEGDIRIYGGFPKLGVPCWGVPIRRTIIYWDL